VRELERQQAAAVRAARAKGVHRDSAPQVVSQALGAASSCDSEPDEP
jgi:hypothetical protein